MKDGEHIVQITGVPDDELRSDSKIEGMEAKSETSKIVRFEEDTIDTIDQSRGKNSKIHQKKADMMRRLQHAEAFPSGANLIYYFGTNGIKNNPLTKRDVEMCDEMLG